MFEAGRRFARSAGAALRRGGLILVLAVTAGCAASPDTYRDPNMDFGSVQTVAVMPFVNLSKDQLANERVRDVFTTLLLGTGALYVVPQGEVARGITASSIAYAATPTPEEVVKFAKMTKVDAVITGVIREYGEVRSGTASSDVISVSMQMIEAQTGRVVWTASCTKGGIGFSDRLLGGGGRPLNDLTEKCLNEIITKLFE
ncbi:GNA1162 family protein [Geobacter sp. DSM 9736]|uniref:GNA1162 family protein n=1 Tax=Geobacter sp. DSM 9736 TaxID=1277350 RepID=UPI000B50CE73|nr:GNA1162 family protein [Geobacter sp. DSM 9736]SNB47142.1 hypothetical protein SAMN06269301_2618 [Geobacter sp. DSM 9736]